MAFTWPFIPDPSDDQLIPFHCTIRLSIPPGVDVNAPPRYRFVPIIATVQTVPLNPEPIDDHALPFHCATSLAGKPAAVLKMPPTYKLAPDTASPVTSENMFAPWLTSPPTPD